MSQDAALTVSGTAAPNHRRSHQKDGAPSYPPHKCSAAKALLAPIEHTLRDPVKADHPKVRHPYVGHGLGDVDFAALLELEARGANLALQPEHRDVSDGLEPSGPPTRYA